MSPSPLSAMVSESCQRRRVGCSKSSRAISSASHEPFTAELRAWASAHMSKATSRTPCAPASPAAIAASASARSDVASSFQIRQRRLKTDNVSSTPAMASECRHEYDGRPWLIGDCEREIHSVSGGADRSLAA
eukprot:scaffold176917_cov33-Tisochrysis_lutea.AAC.2